jgi:hypothetical protein
VRHADHIQPHADDGPTVLQNGQGLCARCNLTKTTAGWTTTGHGTSVLTRTPTGHTYGSVPPEAPRSAPWGSPAGHTDRVPAELIGVQLRDDFWDAAPRVGP